MTTTRTACLALCASLFTVSTAMADPLAPAGVIGSLLFNLQPPPGVDIGELGTFSLSGPGGALQFTAAASPAPFLSATATINSHFFGRSSGLLSYQMQIQGSGTTVPVHVQAAGSVNGFSIIEPFAGFAMRSIWSLENVSTASLLINSDGIITPALSGSFSESFNHGHDLVLTVGQVYRVTMLADAGAAAGSGTVATADAFIDPIFTFGPGAGSDHSFLFSTGIGNSSPAVPEPQSFVLAATGLALACLGRLRSRRKKYARNVKPAQDVSAP